MSHTLTTLIPQTHSVAFRRSNDLHKCLVTAELVKNRFYDVSSTIMFSEETLDCSNNKKKKKTADALKQTKVSSFFCQLY